MNRPFVKRYRTGDSALDEQLLSLIADAGIDENVDLIFEVLVSGMRMGREGVHRGDLKIASASLKEMRYAFHVFDDYRDVLRVAIFGSARTRPDDPRYGHAHDFAKRIADAGWMVITGAGPGIMAAGHEGAGSERSFGVNIQLPFEYDANVFIADDPKLINFRYFFTRKLTFMKESHGFVLFPGGFGTMDEAFELLTLIQTGKMDPAPVVLVDAPGGTYWPMWQDFVEREFLSSGLISPDDLTLFRITHDIDEAIEELCGFYRIFHSMRYVNRRLVLRLRQEPTDEQIRSLNEHFGDIVAKHEIERVEPFQVEIDDDDALDAHRIAFWFDRTSHSRLRQLIDALNRW